MNNIELKNEIDKWDKIFNSSGVFQDYMYELAFFKIFIKFEKFLSDTFENYAIGVQSDFGYCPSRRLEFDDITHLNNILKKENKSYVNHFEIIKKISDSFFNDNPFEIIKSDANYTTIVNEMKCIRDFIAHESISSRSKYISSVLNNKEFKEPYVHLLSIKRSKNSSFYSYYIKSMLEISDYIIYSPV